MVLFPRMNLPTVGVHRFRDTLVKENGRYHSPVWTLKNPDTGKTVTVVAAHIGAQPGYFKNLETMMSEHDGVGQILHLEGVVVPEMRSHIEEPESEADCLLPKTWNHYGSPLYGIDNATNKAVTDWNSVVFGHFGPNPRAVHCYNKATEAMEKNNIRSMMLPLSPYHVPTVLKKLQDNNYRITDELNLEVIRESTSNIYEKKMLTVTGVSRLNHVTNDFFPSIFMVFAVIYTVLFKPEPEQQQQQQQYYGGQGSYPPQYQPQGSYPPQYPPQGSYPPQYPPQYQTGYQAAPPPPPGLPFERSY
eukprot:TRINITY_DN2707_c0_g7_i1.p1 TRINITY_DN2707_c0_g7~~TRINITY_DN2707_c0_g7_i1.p1  ORF type:complete len:310 (+),score=55.73 TRINITY_DN2707_c0_g7_i1:23-931(+)